MRELRRRRQLSQEQLASAIGVHRTLLAHIEGSRRNIRLDTVERIADGLQVSARQLFETSMREGPCRTQANMDLRGTLARNVLELLRAQGMDSCELATRYGFTSGLMRRLESQVANVTVSTVERMALALSVPIGHLFKDEERPVHGLSASPSAWSLPWIGGKALAPALP